MAGSLGCRDVTYSLGWFGFDGEFLLLEILEETELSAGGASRQRTGEAGQRTLKVSFILTPLRIVKRLHSDGEESVKRCRHQGDRKGQKEAGRIGLGGGGG